MPRYYLDRLGLPAEFIRSRAAESEIEEVEELTGLKGMTMDDVYYRCKPEQVRSIQERVKQGKEQHDQNLNARLALKKKSIDLINLSMYSWAGTNEAR